MRELTSYELDTQLAEQLPARELMGCWRPHNKGGDTNQYARGGDGGHNFNLVQANVALINTGNQEATRRTRAAATRSTSPANGHEQGCSWRRARCPRAPRMRTDTRGRLHAAPVRRCGTRE